MPFAIKKRYIAALLLLLACFTLPQYFFAPRARALQSLGAVPRASLDLHLRVKQLEEELARALLAQAQAVPASAPATAPATAPASLPASTPAPALASALPTLPPPPGELLLPSTVHCYAAPDGSDFCEYTNACVDLPDPAAPAGIPVVHLLATAESEAALRTGQGPAHLLLHYKAMRARWPGLALEDLARNGLQSGYTFDYEDVLEARAGQAPRAQPFSSKFTASVMPLQEAAGLRNIAWLDDLYLAPNLLGKHLWGFMASVGSPLVSAHFFNHSAGLGLPPITNLLVSGVLGEERSNAETAYVLGQPWTSAFTANGWAWSWGCLVSLLQWVQGASRSASAGRSSVSGSAPFLGSGRPLEHAPGAQAVQASSAARDALVRGFPWRPPAAEAAPPGPALAGLLGSWRARVWAGSSAAAETAQGAETGEPAYEFQGEGALGAAVGEMLSVCTEARGFGGLSFAAPPLACSSSSAHAPGQASGLFTLPVDALDALQGSFAKSLFCVAAQLCSAAASASAPPPSTPAGAAPPLPFPRELLFRRRSGTAEPGTRLLFTLRDLPPHALHMSAFSWALDLAQQLFGEDPLGVWEGALQQGSGGGAPSAPPPASSPDLALHLSPAADAALAALASTPRLALLAQWLEHRPARLCARRIIGVGTKETLVGGSAEGNLYREWASEVRARLAPHAPLYGPGMVGLQGQVLPFTDLPLAPSKVPILLVDRGQRDNGETVAGAYGRRFHNLADMQRVLDKYGLNYSSVDDEHLRSLSFEQHVRLFSDARVLIMAHSAGLNNALFLPPRSAIIEVSGAQMWCPIYSKALHAAGHHVFPIYSLLNTPQQDYAFSYGSGSAVAQRFRAECERAGSVTASTRPDCWHEARGVPVYTPIHEFEAVLLLAMDAVGAPMQHRGAAFHRLHGVLSEEEWEAGGGPPLLAHMRPGYYEQRAWTLVEPQLAQQAPPASGEGSGNKSANM